MSWYIVFVVSILFVVLHYFQPSSSHERIPASIIPSHIDSVAEVIAFTFKITFLQLITNNYQLLEEMLTNLRRIYGDLDNTRCSLLPDYKKLPNP